MRGKPQVNPLQLKENARTVGAVLALSGNDHASGVDAMRLYPAYLAAVEQLWHFIDGWRSENGAK